MDLRPDRAGSERADQPGQENKTARAIQLREGDDLDEVALLELFRAVIANNRAGGWRALVERGG